MDTGTDFEFDIPTAQQTIFRFSNLAAELRCMIYRFCFTSTWTYQTQNNPAFDASPLETQSILAHRPRYPWQGPVGMIHCYSPEIIFFDSGVSALGRNTEVRHEALRLINIWNPVRINVNDYSKNLNIAGFP